MILPHMILYIGSIIFKKTTQIPGNYPKQYKYKDPYYTIKANFLKKKCILTFGISMKLTESLHVILLSIDNKLLQVDLIILLKVPEV